MRIRRRRAPSGEDHGIVVTGPGIHRVIPLGWPLGAALSWAQSMAFGLQTEDAIYVKQWDELIYLVSKDEDGAVNTFVY